MKRGTITSGLALQTSRQPRRARRCLAACTTIRTKDSPTPTFRLPDKDSTDRETPTIRPMQCPMELARRVWLVDDLGGRGCWRVFDLRASNRGEHAISAHESTVAQHCRKEREARGAGNADHNVRS